MFLSEEVFPLARFSLRLIRLRRMRERVRVPKRKRACMSENNRLMLWRLSLIFGALALAEASVRLGWISSFFLAAPSRAATVLWSELWNGRALLLTAITLYEIAAALTISTLFGLLAGFLLWRYRLIGTSYEMPLAALFSSPVILAYPVFLVT